MEEEKSTAMLNIDSDSRDVEIQDSKDALKLLDNEDLMFETIDLSNIARTEKDLERIRGRIIGSGGKTRDLFENLTNINISVYGKTVSLIGYPEQNRVARKGIDMLLEGSAHGPVYKFLEKKKSELKQSGMGL